MLVYQRVYILYRKPFVSFRSLDLRDRSYLYENLQVVSRRPKGPPHTGGGRGGGSGGSVTRNPWPSLGFPGYGWKFQIIGGTGTPKMDGGFIMENPINPWMIWGENPLFLETSILYVYIYVYVYICIYIYMRLLHPWKQTCPLKRGYFNRKYIWTNRWFSGGHVSFPGGMYIDVYVYIHIFYIYIYICC